MDTAVDIPATGQHYKVITGYEQQQLILEHGMISIRDEEAGLYGSPPAHQVISLGAPSNPWNCKGTIQVFRDMAAEGEKRRLLWPAPVWDGVCPA